MLQIEITPCCKAVGPEPKWAIAYYTFGVYGTRGNVSKMTQLIHNNHNKIYEHLYRNLHLGVAFEPHFGMLLSPGPAQGRTWGPCWNGNPKNYEKLAFWDPLFETDLKQFCMFLQRCFLQRFLNLSYAEFLLPGRPRRVNFEALGRPNATCLC